MKILLDTNVFIDFLSSRQGFFEDAKEVIRYCSNECQGIVAVHTVSTLFYVLKKYMNADKLRTVLFDLFELLDIGSANENSVKQSLLNNDFKDFEDALQYTRAIEQGVDYIITRNKKDFLSSCIPVYTPKEFLDMVGY